MFTGFLKAVKSLATEHPGVAFATAFASATAPAFLKDENRGYFRTAVITTPIIAAMGLAGPGLVTSASRTARAGMQFAREMPMFFGANKATRYKDLRNALERAGGDLGAINPIFRTWADNAAVDFFSQVDRGGPPIEKSMEQAENLFHELLGMSNKRDLLTYAVEGARQKISSPLDLTRVARGGPLAGMAESELRGIVNANRANPKFVRELSSRLGWAKNLKDLGPFANPFKLTMTGKTAKLDWLESYGQLHGQRPEVADAIQRAIRQGHVSSATVVAEQVADGSVGRMLGVNLSGRQGELYLPLFDPKTGAVSLEGKVGVGRHIHTPERVFELDTFVAEHLTQDWGTLKKDIGRAAYFGGVVPEDPFKMSTRLESQLASLSPQALYIRSRAAIPSGLPVYGGKVFEDLTDLERIQYTTKMLGRGMTRIGSEGGTSKGVFEFGESELFIPGGAPSLAKQTYFYRSFTKDLQLKAGTIGEGMRPSFTTSAVEDIGGVPEIQMAVAGVSPQQKSLFGDLPKTAEGMAAYKETAIQRILTDNPKLTRGEAEAAWGKISGKLGEKGYLEAGRGLGSLGEGDIILHEKFRQLKMESRKNIYVDKLHLNPEDYINKSLTPETLIGFEGLNPVTSEAPATFIEGWSTTPSGQFELKLRQEYPIETGAKIDIAGVKGLGIVPEEDVFRRQVELLNLYHEATGSKQVIPSFVEALAPLHYMQAKTSDPFRLMVSQAAAVSSDIAANSVHLKADWANLEALDRVNKYMADLSAQGIRAQRTGPGNNIFRLIEDSEYVRNLNLENRRLRMQSVGQLTEDYLRDVANLAKGNAPGTEGEIFSAFRRSGEENLLNYMQKNAMFSFAAFWDSTRRNVPQMVGATYDMFSEMWRAGNVEGIRELMGRLDFHGGDPGRAAAFARQFVEGDFTKAMGEVVPIGEAAARLDIGRMEGRVGGIFDPSNKLVQENFSLKLDQPVYARVAGRDIEVSHIPVLGKLAHGGGSNLYEKAGEGLTYSPTDYEKTLAEVVRWQKDPVMMSAAISAHLDEAQRVLFGKEGFYRARGTDVTGAVSGFIQTRAQENPFELLINKQMAARVRDKEIREALMSGQDVYATAARHPIQSAPYMRVKVAPDAGMGPNMIGMDERIRGLFGADDDKDILNMFFYRKSSQAEREAQAAINMLDSNQWRSLKTLDMLYGSVEDSRNIASAGVKSLPELLKESLSMATEGGRAEQVANRMAGGVVGAYSNLLTRLYMNVEMHPTIGVKPAERDLLGHMLWTIRQVPISAQKGKMKLNPEDTLDLYRRLVAGLESRSPEGVNQFTEAMKEVITGYGKESVITAETAPLFEQLTGMKVGAGTKRNVLMDVLESKNFQSTLSEFIMNRNVRADRAAELLTKATTDMSGDSLYRLQALYKEMGTPPPWLIGLAREKGSGMGVSKVLGAINEGVKGAYRASKGNLGVLALGVGVAAAGGIITSRIRKVAPTQAVFGRSRGNFRPETTEATPDQVPGEPMTGAMSSVNPPRRQLALRGGTATTIVAPMRQRTDLEVRMKAQRQQDTIEIQRMIGQISGGSGVSNINVNYRNGWRNNMSTLRRRETIREQLES